MANGEGVLRKGGRPVVGIVTGSPNDLALVRKAEATLHALDIPCEVHAMSAHRTPDHVVAYVTTARERGIEVLIACAGMAAHLAGVVAAHTTLPVIGVPLASGTLGGFDALLSTVQMPPGVPVATVGVDATRNAGFLAARILAGRHPEITGRIEAQLQEDRARYGAPPVPTATGAREARGAAETSTAETSTAATSTAATSTAAPSAAAPSGARAGKKRKKKDKGKGRGGR